MPEIETKNGRDALQVIDLIIQEGQPKPEDLQAAGDWLADKRAMETFAGKGVEGEVFAPYSPEYERRKGEWLVNLYSNKADTHMLSNVRARVDGDELQVGVFNNDELAAKARILNEGGEIPTRYGGFKAGYKGGRVKYGPAPKRPIGKKGYATIPARNWLGASQSDLDHMAEIVGESIDHRTQVALDSLFGGF